MNKTDVERSLAILEADLAGGRQRRPSRPATVRRAIMPGDFPPGVHPDDWEPDDEVERGPVVRDPDPDAGRW